MKKFFNNSKITPAPKEDTWQGVGQAQIEKYLQNIASEQQIFEDELRAEVFKERMDNLNEIDSEGTCNCCKIC